MNRSHPWIAGCLLLACDKHEAVGPVDAMTKVDALALAAGKVPALTSTSGKRPCGVDWVGEKDASLAKIPDPTLARALVDLAGDAVPLRVPVYRRDDGAHVVVDCMGHTSRTDWSGRDPSRES